MSHIDELIATLCPDGVPYLAIGSAKVSDKVVAGATPKTGRPEFWDDGTIPWMSSGEVNKGTVYETDQFITQIAYDSTSTKLVPAGTVVMALAGQGKTRGTVARTRIELCTNQSLASIVVAEEMDSDFLYYYLQTQYQKLRDVSSGEGARGGLNLQMIKAYKVPVPPLEVQRAIVEVLDTFSKLESELESELEARKQQYEYYRAELVEHEDAPVISVGEIVNSISSGRNKSRADGGYFPVYGSTGQIGTTDEAPYSGDALLVARVGANAGRVNAVSGQYDVSDNTLIVIPNETWDVRYAFHQLTRMNLNQYAVGGGQPLVTGKLLKSLKIHLPSLTKQRHVAEVLDRFDVLVKDLSIGLPAELAARRQQYGYYRDKLLTFREAA